MFYSRNHNINIMYLNRNYPFHITRHEKKLGSCRNEFCPNDSQQNEALKCFISKTKASISCIPMGFTNSHFPLREKLDSCHERSSSRWFPTKWRVEMLFYQNQALISCIPMGTTGKCLVWCIFLSTFRILCVLMLKVPWHFTRFCVL